MEGKEVVMQPQMQYMNPMMQPQVRFSQMR